jgi:hypothetical protein
MSKHSVCQFRSLVNVPTAMVLACSRVTQGPGYGHGDRALDGDTDLSDLVMLISSYGTAFE